MKRTIVPPHERAALTTHRLPPDGHAGHGVTEDAPEAQAAPSGVISYSRVFRCSCGDELVAPES
jgi:hypothetical protein